MKKSSNFNEEILYEIWEQDTQEMLNKYQITIHPMYILGAAHRVDSNQIESLIFNSEYFLESHIEHLFILLNNGLDYSEAINILWLDKMAVEMVDSEYSPTSLLLKENIITIDKVYEAISFSSEHEYVNKYKKEINFKDRYKEEGLV